MPKHRKTQHQRSKKRFTKSRRVRKQHGGGCEEIRNVPSGFFLFCDILSPAEEAKILSDIAETSKNASSVFQNISATHGRRNLRIELDEMPSYLKGTVFEALFTKPASELSGKVAEVKHVIETLETEGGYMFNANHFLINNYGPDIGIAAHVNSTSYGPLVIGISLGGDCTFVLRHVSGGSAISYTVPARSIYIMSGPSRYEFTHEIPKLPAGTKRVSITVRDSAPASMGAIEGGGSATSAAGSNTAGVWNGETNVIPNRGRHNEFEGF